VTADASAVYDASVVGRPPETDVVARAKRGDADAYEALLRMHEHVAFRTACAIVGSAADAEEVTQEAFVKAYNALPRFRTGSPFRPWLLRIVANEARNRRRTLGRRAHLLNRAADEAASGDPARSPEAELVDAERRDELFAALARLKEEERTAIIARYFIGLTDEETAAALGVRRGAVKMRVFRALEHLRAELGVTVDA
jgi:RNA polymerase sigma-70 factor (ECF subfamily)